MPKVLLLLAEGFEEIEAIAAIDVMRRGGIEVVVAGVLSESVKGAHGVIVQSDVLLSSVASSEGFDMVVLPGGGPGTKVLTENEKVQSLVKEFDAKNLQIAAICAAPMALEKAGVLKEQYTCYPGCESSIQSSQFVLEKVVESGNVLTSRGPGTAICFGLAIVKKLVGEAKYAQLKQGLLAEYC